MTAVGAVDVRNNFDSIFDRVFSGETIDITGTDNRNVIMISKSEYDEMERQRKNAEYLTAVDQGRTDIAAGKGIKKTLKELREMEDE